MSIDPKKGGKCWSCIHCEDIATQNNNSDAKYFRKCKNANHKYIDACCFSCADYVHDPKYPENEIAPAIFSNDGTVKVNNPASPAYKPPSPPAHTPPAYTPPSAPPTAKQKKGGKVAVIIAIVAVIIALCAVGFLVYNMYFSSDSNSSNSSNKNSQSEETYLYISAVTVGTGHTVPMKKEADSASSTVSSIPDRADITILKKETDWWYVEYGGKKGWCEAKYIIESTDYVDLAYVVISTSGTSANMYAQASSTAAAVAKIPNNTTIRVVKQNGSWSYVIYNEYIGWCLTGDLVDTNDILSESAIVTSSSATLTMRDSASTSGKTVCTIDKGSYVTVIRSNGDWYFVKYSGKTGWCPASSITFKEVFGSGKYVIVTTDQYELRIREYGSLSAEVLGFIPKGTVVRFYSVSNGWYYVEYGGIEGWCSGDKLTVIY